jgi:soluble lytic murein transglycosylase
VGRRGKADDATSSRFWAGGTRTAVTILIVAALAVGVVGVLADDDVERRVQGRLYPMKYETEIKEAAATYDVDPYLLAAVAKAESGFDPRAESAAGALGMMQLMPDTAVWIQGRDDWDGGAVDDLRDPEASLALGAYYLHYLTDLYDGDVRLALAAYNAGQGTVAGWLREAGTPETLGSEDIPFPETRDFVDRVEKFRDLYRDVHPEVFVTSATGRDEARGAVGDAT